MSTPRALILGCAGPQLSRSERAFFADAQPWGFILFGRNIQAPDQLRALVADLRAAVGRAAPVLVDQEGGRVQRLAPPHWFGWMPPLDQGALVLEPVRAMYLRGRVIAAELTAAGIDVNCAPLADIARPETHVFLRNRCYGDTPEDVTARARAMADGLMDGGVLPVLKHLPGHGRARVDSHMALPVVDAGLDALKDTDFAPFRALSDLPLGMTGHLRFPKLDPQAPVTTSPTLIALIRERLGFDGALMTDDISMSALRGPVAARAEAALAAGCDLVLHCNGAPHEMAALAEICLPLSGEAARRCDAALAQRRAPKPDTLEDLAAAYAALLPEG